MHMSEQPGQYLSPEQIQATFDALGQKRIMPDCYCETLPEIPCPRHEPEAYE